MPCVHGPRKPEGAVRPSDLDDPNEFATKELLQLAMADLNLRARAYDRILKVARTIADLAGAGNVASDHVSEAIQYRSQDRQLRTQAIAIDCQY
jgi:predicted ATPase with chaperone activity